MKLQYLYSVTRRAIDTYEMIQPNDNIAIGVSGGKDSLTLLYALAGLRRFYPNPFTLEAISVDLGIGIQDFSKLHALCNELDIQISIVKTEIGPIIFEKRKETNPCSLCAKMRKGAFNEKAKSLNCNKVAYAHHKDDIVETMLLSLIFEGRFHSFSPVTYLDRTDLTVIRPLMYANEAEIKTFVQRMNLPVMKSPCPIDGYTKREYAKNLVKQLNQDHVHTKDRMFNAIEQGIFNKSI